VRRGILDRAEIFEKFAASCFHFVPRGRGRSSVTNYKTAIYGEGAQSADESSSGDEDKRAAVDELAF
jgi:hypothetical protein